MTTEDPVSMIVKMGFPADRAEIIHAFVGGSALQGVKLQGTDDTDVCGAYIEKPWLTLGIETMEHFRSLDLTPVASKCSDRR
jgi:hypothetical protein